MIKVKINNGFEKYDEVFDYKTKYTSCQDDQGIEVKIRRIKEYDEEKWKDGKIHEFNTLREASDFMDSCDIDFTDDYAAQFGVWEDVIDMDYYIDSSEDNLLIFMIGYHREWED